MRPVVPILIWRQQKSAGVATQQWWCGMFGRKNTPPAGTLSDCQAGTKESEDCTLIITEGHLGGRNHRSSQLSAGFVLKGKDVTLPQK